MCCHCELCQVEFRLELNDEQYMGKSIIMNKNRQMMIIRMRKRKLPKNYQNIILRYFHNKTFLK
jgi:hypothetical protein